MAAEAPTWLVKGPRTSAPQAWRMPKTYPLSPEWSREGPVALSCPLSLCRGAGEQARLCLQAPGTSLQLVPAASPTPPGQPRGSQADVMPREAVCCGCHRVFTPHDKPGPGVNFHYSQCTPTCVFKGYNFYQLQLELFLFLSP